MSDVTQILRQIEGGDEAASAQLLPLVYEELRKLAGARLANEKLAQTLQPTALVHEAYLRLVDQERDQSWDNRRHFFSAAAESMRRILVERAHRRKALKRGGDLNRVEFDENQQAGAGDNIELLALDEALQRLETKDPVKAELVKLRFFGGLTMAQSAEALGIGLSTADKYWAYAKCWLRDEITKD